MAVLNWGAPKIEYIKAKNGAPDTTGDTWHTFGDIVEGTTALETTAGDKVEAKNEAGEVIDTRQNKSTFSLSFELFKKKGETKPIQDDDGVITQNYAIRLTPEDPTTEGFIFPNASVSLDETYTAADGTHYKYTFNALKPSANYGTGTTKGKMMQPYLASDSDSDSE